MKKAIASVLAASMALSLAACGGSSTATSSSTATESTASSTTAESTASGDKVTLRMAGPSRCKAAILSTSLSRASLTN